jgi:hypothetical protein
VLPRTARSLHRRIRPDPGRRERSPAVDPSDIGVHNVQPYYATARIRPLFRQRRDLARARIDALGRTGKAGRVFYLDGCNLDTDRTFTSRKFTVTADGADRQ